MRSSTHRSSPLDTQQRIKRSRVALNTRSIFREQAIADAGLGAQKARALRVLLELLAQARDVHVEVVIFVPVLRPPHFAQEHRVGDDAIRVAREREQQRVLRWREMYLLVVD